MAERIMKRLKFPSREISLVTKIIANHRVSYRSESDVKRMLGRIGEEAFFMLLRLKLADDSSKGYFDEKSLSSLEWAKITAEKIISEKQCVHICDLALGGEELMKMGFKGKEIGAVLYKLLELVIDNKLENKAEILKNYIMSTEMNDDNYAS